MTLLDACHKVVSKSKNQQLKDELISELDAMNPDGQAFIEARFLLQHRKEIMQVINFIKVLSA